MKRRLILVLAVAVLLFNQSVFAERIVAWTDYGCYAPDGNDFVAVAAGNSFAIALRSDGSLTAWGNNSNGECNVPDDSDFVAIEAGGSHGLALRSDNSLIAWGDNTWGQLNVPDDNDIVAIAAGSTHNLALRSDGSMVGWGHNANGQATPLSGNDFVAVAAGNSHSLALKADGSVVAWGINNHGQYSVPQGNDFVAVTCGVYHNLAVRSNGSIVGWGYNSKGQASFYPTGSGFVDVAAGSQHSLALKADGSAVAWGVNTYGECNVPDGVHFLAISIHHSCNFGLVSIGNECVNAIPVQLNVPYNGSTEYATGTGLSSCSSNDTNDVWHSFTPEVTANFTISLCGSTFDTTLSVFDDCGGSEIACNDDTQPGICSSKFQSQLTVALEKESKYLIRIAGYDGNIGDYTLKVTGPECPEAIAGDSNGDCKLNLKDFAILCQGWLDCNLDPPEACWE